MKSKKCSKCNTLKLLNEFDNHIFCKYGVSAECKQCQKERKINNKRTKAGLIKDIYRSQNSNAKKRGMHQPTYSVGELIEWAMSQRSFHELYDNWKVSEYKKYKRPSFDRVSNELSYTLDNLRIVTWAENKQQIHEDQKNGTDGRMNMAVLEIDSCGNIKNWWHSVRHAERAVGYSNDSIGKVCRGQRQSLYGDKYMYETDYIVWRGDSAIKRWKKLNESNK